MQLLIHAGISQTMLVKGATGVWNNKSKWDHKAFGHNEQILYLDHVETQNICACIAGLLSTFIRMVN